MRELEAVIEAGVLADLKEGDARSGFRIVAAVDDAPNAGVDEGPGAHRAWLEGDVDRHLAQAKGPEAMGCGAKGDKLSVRGRILAPLARISAARDDLILIDGDSAHGHLAERRRGVRLAHRLSHERLVALILISHHRFKGWFETSRKPCRRDFFRGTP